MSLDISGLTDYSWSDIAKAAKAAMVMAAVGGQSVLRVGTTTQRITISEAKVLYDLASEQANLEASGDAGGQIVLARFGEPQ